MKEKVISLLLASLALLLAAWAGLNYLARHTLPAEIRNLFSIMFLLWFAGILTRRDRDDDWAGQC
ncbi:hypothetical protein C8P68_102934 [Mucilaginibacter yixingensis]|uniref:Uncharacterized protein n=1 Tax=Mucilaginibacter yixingensis TaxID=1295612 RepID=A0A2T5JE98_9SPHI|nr:hypothetical protein [Mucilaginibacter yixingensis]PTR00102.1 hypothetical protein C8P68_102934 [Mucilaginibacter yixingensis]